MRSSLLLVKRVLERKMNSSIFSIVDDIPYPPPWRNLDDLTEQELQKIGNAHGTQSLSEGHFTSPAFPVTGVAHGPNTRFMVPLVCQHASKPDSPIVNVWFMIDTMAYDMYISKQTMCKLLGQAYSPTVELPPIIDVKIQDRDNTMKCLTSHSVFKEANILGMSMLEKLRLAFLTNWDKNEVKLIYCPK